MKHNEDLLVRLKSEIENDIMTLENIIRQYGSYNVIANAIVHTHMEAGYTNKKDLPAPPPTLPEYITLICLKFPYSLGLGEFSNPRSIGKDMFDMMHLAKKIIQKYNYVHFSKFDIIKDGNISDIDYFAQSISADELFVRNETFEEFHWDLLENLYEPYDDECNLSLGFTINDAIRICITISDFLSEATVRFIENAKSSSQKMYDEIIAYKYRKKKPQNFYPQEMLDQYISASDEDLKMHFRESMYSYQLVTAGHNLSFTAKTIADMEDLEVSIVQKFLNCLSLEFGETNPDFSKPEIIHPLKDKPLIRHEDTYICPSTSLLDYSLDRLFHKRVIMEGKGNSGVRLNKRHDYLVETGVKYFTDTLQSKEYYLNLKYPGGEMDGLVVCGNNVFFIEGKGHTLSDRARKGFVDRLEKHIEAIVEESHAQAVRSFNYLFGKANVEFKEPSGKKVFIDGTRFKKAYFICLTIESLKSISCNLKIKNTLGLFTVDTFPWLVNLYDLRTICEHMEGPSYFIQYMHRRREFFKYPKFIVKDELDLLGYYLNQNLRFDGVVNEDSFDMVMLAYLDSPYLDQLNQYYFYKHGKLKKEVPKMVYKAPLAYKTFIKALEDSHLPNSIDAAVMVLEFDSKTKNTVLNYLKKVHKRLSKDGEDHDFRIVGDDVDGKTWMFSYMLTMDTENVDDFFEDFTKKKFFENPCNNYVAILDTGKKEFAFRKILYLTNPTFEKK